MRLYRSLFPKFIDSHIWAALLVSLGFISARIFEDVGLNSRLSEGSEVYTCTLEYNRQ